MRTSPKIGNSHLEQMNLINDFICHFDVGNLLYAINGKHLDEDEILSVTNDISEYHAKLKRQKQYLFKFCKNFPKEFASDDNKLVDSSVKISWRMRSGTAGVKRVFKKFCTVSHKKMPPGVPERQAYQVSLITAKNHILDLFGLSSYPQCVKELFLVMFDFYIDLNECLSEGLRTVKQVNTIKGDAEKCLEILLASCEKSKKNQQLLIEAIMSDPEMKKAVMNNKTLSGDDENPVLKDYKKGKATKKEFAQKYYKNCSPKDVDRITIYEANTEATEDPEMSFAKVVFGKDEKKIQRINCIIQHFDELLPDKCKRNKIPSLYLFFFYEWCSPITGVESFLRYFDKHYKEGGGKLDPIGKSAITGARTKHTQCKDGSTERIKKEMIDKIESLLKENLPKMEIAS